MAETQLQCSVCSRQFSRLEHLKRHALIHQGDKPFKCDQCSKLFSRKYASCVFLKACTDSFSEMRSYVMSKATRHLQHKPLPLSVEHVLLAQRRALSALAQVLATFVPLETSCVCSDHDRSGDDLISVMTVHEVRKRLSSNNPLKRVRQLKPSVLKTHFQSTLIQMYSTSLTRSR